MTLREFLAGRPAYDRQASSGPAWLVVPATGIILLAGQVTTLAAFMLPGIGLAEGSASPAGLRRDLLWFVCLSQVAIVALVLLVPKATPNVRALRLSWPEGGAAAFAWSLVVMIPLLVLFNALAYTLAPALYAEDFRAFRQLANGSPLPETAFAIGIGAPLSEELLFRGYLLSSLAATGLGFWAGAVLATAGWTVLHLSYSWVGLLEVFLIGIYFCWLLWRTGSLLPALLCHAAYNSMLLAVLRIWFP